MKVFGSDAILTRTVEGKLWVPVGPRGEAFFGTEGEWHERVTVEWCSRICGPGAREDAHRPE